MTIHFLDTTPKKTLSRVLANHEGVGKYYYSRLIGNDFQETDILYKREDDGRWNCRRYLYHLNLLLDHLKRLYGDGADSNERKLVNRLRRLDELAKDCIGHKVLECLIETWIGHEWQMAFTPICKEPIDKAKKEFEDKKKKVEESLKRLNGIIPPEDLAETKRRFDDELDKSKAKMASNIDNHFMYLCLNTGFLEIPLKRTKGEHKAAIRGILDMYDIIKSNTPLSPTYKIPGSISELLKLVGVEKSKDNVKKIIRKHRPITS